MIHLGTLNQQQLSEVLQRIENGQKTGVIVINKDNIREEIYLYQGQVVTIISARPCEPLVRRLVHADMISVNDLQKVPTNMGKMISQAQEFSQYSDTQVATILMQLGLISQKQLATWVKQETVEALQQLLIGTGREIYFEENVQPPTDCLYLLLTASTPESTLLPQTISYDDGIVEEGHQNPITPLPMLFKKSEPVTDSKQFVPVTPSGFAQLPGVVLTAQDRIQRTVSAILPQTFADDGLTAKVATPPRANPLFRWETLLIIAVLLIAGLAHGINMFHFPYFENDEGTYMSQAWTVVHEGNSHLTRIGTIMLQVVGYRLQLGPLLQEDFILFGFVNNSGRVLMLLFQVASTFMLYLIARKSSGSVTAAVIASLLFALSAYGIFFHRRVLLDNITTFWMLLSILLLLSDRLYLKRVWLSAVALGLSILSKELTIFLIPALAYLVFFRAGKSHRFFAIIGWLAIVISVISLYLLMATLKNELFPSGTFLGGTAPHVSLLGTLQYQASRGKDGGFFDLRSAIWGYLQMWVQDDPLLVAGGSFCAIVSVIIIRWNRLTGIIGLLTISLYMFLGRGGEVIGFYLVPLLPLLALNIGLIVGVGADKLEKSARKFLHSNKVLSRTIPLVTIALCLCSGIFMSYTNPNLYPGFHVAQLWTGTQADAQNETIEWVKEHISPNSTIIIDDYMWTDLRDTGKPPLSYKNIYWYWKIDLDPAISVGVFHSNWRYADYIIVTPQMLHDVKESHLKLMNEILSHSTVIKFFSSQDGWPLEIRKVNK